jgi:hypothetical protein
MLELDELKSLHDKAYNHNQVTRERAADDLVFYWVTQWDDNLLGESQLSYRGEFNILRKAGRQILADLRSNPIQVDFEPTEENADDGAELLDGLYRSSDRSNTSIEAYDNANTENVVCGFGAWELYTEYESNRVGDERQVIKRKPIWEANNAAYVDPNAKLADKSDGKYWSVLTSYSEDGYKDLAEELTGERPDNVGQSFKHPEESYVFPWFSEDKKIWVTSFYHKTKELEKILALEDPFGSVVTVREDSIAEVEDELIAAGYSVVDERTVERWVIHKYIASGEEILSCDRIPGEEIPVVPVYGERSFVEGEEHWEGVTRLAKDPQRLRNFQLSYLADIVSRSPRNKPIFHRDQIAGYENMYEENGADNNFPYYLMNRTDANGEMLPIGPVGEMPEQKMPTSLVASIDLSRQAVEDVANPGIPQDIADPDLSGKAVMALQSRLDQQSIVYQQNMKHSKRYDAKVYASMAAEVYDSPRTVMITLPDGQQKQMKIMETVIDRQTGKAVTLNDLTGSEFEVYSKIGQSYQTIKEQTMDRLTQMAQAVGPTDPMFKILSLKLLQMTDGADFDDLRQYAHKQLLLEGIKEPESDDDKEFLAQAQQSKAPDPNMVLAMAEDKKGQAALLREQREMFSAQHKAQNEQGKLVIDQFEAETDRMDTQIEAQKAGADIDNTRIDSFGKQLDNAAKASQLSARGMAISTG